MRWSLRKIWIHGWKYLLLQQAERSLPYCLVNVCALSFSRVLKFLNQLFIRHYFCKQGSVLQEWKNSILLIIIKKKWTVLKFSAFKMNSVTAHPECVAPGPETGSHKSPGSPSDPREAVNLRPPPDLLSLPPFQRNSLPLTARHPQKRQQRYFRIPYILSYLNISVLD